MDRQYLLALITCLVMVQAPIVGAISFQKVSKTDEAGKFPAAIDELLLQAKQGGMAAQYKLGVMYEGGQEVKTDFKEAARWYRLAAEQGHPNAQFRLAFLCELGLGVPEDGRKAVMWYRTAAEQGHLDSQYELGLNYENGSGVSRDSREAVKWFRLAAEQGHANAQLRLAKIYQQGREGIPPDDKEMIKWYRLAAENDDTWSNSLYPALEFRLGQMYATGERVRQDYKEAAKWYRLAAERDGGDNTRAEFELARMYALGKGVVRDHDEAVKWYRMAAKRGDYVPFRMEGLISEVEQEELDWYRLAAEGGYEEAQFLLGEMYAHGKGVGQDYVEAVKWYRLAAKRDTEAQRVAQTRLGELYTFGKGVAQDHKQAVKWYRLAAEREERVAQFRLGELYTSGEGVAQNYKEAVRWYQRAAESWLPGAQANLGYMYDTGLGVLQDPVLAHMWYSLAAARGSHFAAKKRDLLSVRMTYSEIAEARNLAKNRESDIWNISELPTGIRHPIFIKPLLSFGESISWEKGVEPISYTGTGFFVSGDGYALTNSHVVKGAKKIFVSLGGEKMSATVVAQDGVNDIALLTVDGNFSVLPVAFGQPGMVGDEISVLGYPNVIMQGGEQKATFGFVNSRSGIADDNRYFQISSPIQPGNSGSPMLDKFGGVIGIVTSTLNNKKMSEITGASPQNVNYAIKIGYALPLLEEHKVNYKKASTWRSFSRALLVERASDSVILVVAEH